MYISMQHLCEQSKGFLYPHSKENRGKYDFKKTGIGKSKGNIHH